MVNSIFSGTAWIELQGDHALDFIGLQDYAEYQVVGFENPIIVRDYRSIGLKAIAQVLETQQVNSFAPQFNAPAQVDISETSSCGLLIELQDTDDPDPAHRLWIDIGIGDSIPAYDYVFDRLVPLGDNRFAFLALFLRPGAELELPSPALLLEV
jgi:hypothetical protein